MTNGLYRALLALYPREYRFVFGEEMVAVYSDAAAKCRNCGLLGYSWFVARECGGLVGGLVREWRARSRGETEYLEVLPAMAVAVGTSTEIADVQVRLRRALKRMELAIAWHDFPGARRYSEEERVLRQELNHFYARHQIG
jgi:hypothetical protein